MLCVTVGFVVNQSCCVVLFVNTLSRRAPFCSAFCNCFCQPVLVPTHPEAVHIGLYVLFHNGRFRSCYVYTAPEKLVMIWRTTTHTSKRMCHRAVLYNISQKKTNIDVICGALYKQTKRTHDSMTIQKCTITLATTQFSV